MPEHIPIKLTGVVTWETKFKKEGDASSESDAYNICCLLYWGLHVMQTNWLIYECSFF